jgi:hypothetical protein
LPGRIYAAKKSSAAPPVYSLRTKNPPGEFGPPVSFGTDPSVLHDFLNTDQAINRRRRDGAPTQA